MATHLRMPVWRVLREISGQEFGQWCAYLSLQHEAENPASEADQQLAALFGAED